MTNPALNAPIVLETNRTIRTTREKAYRAWTDPRQLKKWFAVSEVFTTPIAEVDLKVGGRYRLGMKAPGDNPILVVGGEYQEITPPERLVFTWRWETADPNELETLVTVEFIAGDEGTEIRLKHERFTDIASRDRHGEGWAGCFDNLERLFENNN
jgi:uncharacterized protein YndB with AHSA1/START domain